MFKSFWDFFREQPPAPAPTIVLESGLQTLKNHKYGDFKKNKDAYIAAFLKIAAASPRRAIILFMQLEKERHPTKTDDFFAQAAPHISELLGKCNRSEKRDIYKTILGSAPQANLADFIIEQANNLAEILKGELGEKLAEKIIEHSKPRTKEILDIFAVHFDSLLNDHLAKNHLFSLLVTKQLCKAYRDINEPLPPYLEALRSGFVEKAIRCIVTKSESKNYADINAQLCDINGLGIEKTDNIKVYKSAVDHKGNSKVGQVALYQMNYSILGTKQPFILNLVCVEAKCAANNLKPITVLAHNNLRDLQHAFSMTAHSHAEIEAFNQIVKPLIKPIDYKASFSNPVYTQPTVTLSLTLQPSFMYVSELTERTNGVDLAHGQFSPSPHRNFFPVKHHQPPEVR